MEFKLKFTDFTPEELLGKTVLYEYGSSYGSYNPSQGIRTISKILKDRFKISKSSGEMEDKMFSIVDGMGAGGYSRMDMGRVSRCYLITPEEKDEILRGWFINKETRRLKEFIKNKIDELSYDKMIEIEKIINLK